VAWPIIASALEDELGVSLEFISAPQESDEGQRMRAWIVDQVAFVDRQKLHMEAERILR
jgi:ABC-type phosphate/phosphonate transport system substrate-binding protein